jgi:GMP reductase
LLPRKAKISSRSKADVSVALGNHKFNIPIIPSNMRCVIDEEIAKKLSEAGYFYVMHRYDVDILKFVKKANKENWKVISISIGAKDIESTLLEQLVKSGCRIDYITIDVAHGHSDYMCRMIRVVKEQFHKTFVIAGNVATQGGVGDLQDWGADAVKIGIGGGSPCSTKYKTGFTCPMFSCIKDCASIATVPLIADGGIQHNGDIAKALVAGASFGMAGGMFAACYDSPAEIVYPGPNNSSACYSKRYFGSASHQNKGERRHIEGFEVLLKGNEMRYMEKLEEITQDLQSAVSYAGGTDLSSMDRVYYVINR